MNTPELIHAGMLDMQVCVPADFTDEAVEAFANTANPAGTEGGWRIRRAGDPALNGDPERATCLQRYGCVHLKLDC